MGGSKRRATSYHTFCSVEVLKVDENIDHHRDKVCKMLNYKHGQVISRCKSRPIYFKYE